MKVFTIHIKKTALRTVDLALKLQGYLMSLLPTDYVADLHQQAINPYATHLTSNRQEQVWTVSLLTEEATKRIAPVLEGLTSISLTSYETPLVVTKIEIVNWTADELEQIFRETPTDGRFTIRLLSPTSFKSQGEYSFYPTVRLILQSLMKKYQHLIEEREDFDHDLLEMLEKQTKIVAYDLKSWYFKVHGHQIPGCQGSVTLKVYGAETLKAYVNLLLHFGEYSGLGIKTSLGMGGMKLEFKDS